MMQRWDPSWEGGAWQREVRWSSRNICLQVGVTLLRVRYQSFKWGETVRTSYDLSLVMTCSFSNWVAMTNQRQNSFLLSPVKGPWISNRAEWSAFSSRLSSSWYRSSFFFRLQLVTDNVIEANSLHITRGHRGWSSKNMHICSSSVWSSSGISCLFRHDSCCKPTRLLKMLTVWSFTLWVWLG